jgi:ubiquinone biosynthesis protein Coq4
MVAIRKSGASTIKQSTRQDKERMMVDMSRNTNEASNNLFNKKQDEHLEADLKQLREHLRMYEVECSGLRAAGFENAQDLFTSYEGVRQKLEAAKAEIEHLKQSRENFATHAENSLKQLAAANAEIETLRRDADRYRFVRQADQTVILKLSHYAFEALDAAIDKARGVA